MGVDRAMPPTLRLVGAADGHDLVPCPRCNGRGRVPAPKTFSVRTNVHYVGGEGYGAVITPGSGAPIPCPLCRGRRVIPVADPTPDPAAPTHG